MINMFGNELTETQKIDYIYKELKSQKKWGYIRSFIKVLILIGLIYIYNTVDMDKLIKDISSKIAPQMSSFIAPISKDLMNNIVKDIGNNIQVDQEMIKN